MGNIDSRALSSIPLISQAKSLIQVIGGDAAGAKKTQEEFYRTGIIASQVNSAVHLIQGDVKEADKILKEFGKETLTLVWGVPREKRLPWEPEKVGRRRRSIDDISNFDMGQSDLPNDLLTFLPGSFNDLSFNDSMPATSMIDTVLSVFLVTQLMKIRHPRSNPFFQEICFSSYPALPYDDCLTLVLKSLHKFDGTTDAKSDSIEFSDSDQITHSAPWPLGPLALRDQTVTSSNFFIDLLETVELELESLTSENLLGYIMESATCNNSDEKIDCHELFKALKSGLKGIKEQVNAMQL